MPARTGLRSFRLRQHTPVSLKGFSVEGIETRRKRRAQDAPENVTRDLDIPLPPTFGHGSLSTLTSHTSYG